MHQAHTQLVASVRHLQHVKCQHLGDCEQHSNQPDQSHLHCFPQRDTHPLHSAPWRHCMVATQTAYRYIYYWLPSLMFVMWVEKKTTYRSILRAHRLRTVIPTEAFWIKGINLQTYTPNGQSSAISYKSKIMETDGGTTLMREIKEVSPVQTHGHTSFEVHEWVLSFLSFPLSLHQLKPKATRLSSSSWLWNFIPVVIKSVQYQDIVFNYKCFDIVRHFKVVSSNTRLCNISIFKTEPVNVSRTSLISRQKPEILNLWIRKASISS